MQSVIASIRRWLLRFMRYGTNVVACATAQPMTRLRIHVQPDESGDVGEVEAEVTPVIEVAAADTEQGSETEAEVTPVVEVAAANTKQVPAADFIECDDSMLAALYH